MSVRHIRKNDIVMVIRGAHSGKTGKVLDVSASGERAFVEGVNLVKKCMRKSQEHPQGGITDKEASLAVSNLVPYCPECKKGVRVARVMEGEKKIRKCRKCGYHFDR